MFVEVRALGVERQPAAGVDVEREEIAHRPRVLGAVQPLKRTAAGIRLDRRGGVHVRFERGDERRVGRGVGTRRERRRHEAGLQLANHLLRHFRCLRRVRDIERGERQAAGLAFVAVASGAVAANNGIEILRMRGDRLRGRRGSARRCLYGRRRFRRG